MKKQITEYYCDICGKQCKESEKKLAIVIRPDDGNGLGPSYLICNFYARIPQLYSNDGQVCRKCVDEILIKHYLEKASFIKFFEYIVDEQLSEKHIQAIADIVNFINECKESEDEIFAFSRYLRRRYGQEETADCLPDELIDCREEKSNAQTDSDRDTDTN